MPKMRGPALRISGMPPLHFSGKQGGRNEKQRRQEDGA